MFHRCLSLRHPNPRLLCALTNFNPSSGRVLSNKCPCSSLLIRSGGDIPTAIFSSPTDRNPRIILPNRTRDIVTIIPHPTCTQAICRATWRWRWLSTDRKGKPYVGICHHLVPNLLDYRPANLLCWLTRQQHGTADYRQRALKTVVPNGNLYLFSFERLRQLQDPRVTSDIDFERELAAIRAKGYHIDPRSTDEIMQSDMSHHMEC